MSDLLRRVSTLARRRRKLTTEYERAMLAAAQMHTQRDIAHAAGVTKQAVGEYLRARKESEQ